MLAGLIEPSTGQVRVGGEPLSRQNAARLRTRIGFLTEAPGLWERLTVRRNLLVYARLYGLAPAARAVDEVLAMFGILDRANQPAVELSKGLKQRVALARTLLHRPDIVLLDEPTAGLDPESARDVRELILQLQRNGRTVLLSTHNLDEVERVATRVAVLRTRLIAVDTPAALRARVFGSRVRVTFGEVDPRFASALKRAGFPDVHDNDTSLSVAVDDPRDATPRIVKTLVESGAAILGVVAEQPPLEEVYLRLLGTGGSEDPPLRSQ